MVVEQGGFAARIGRVFSASLDLGDGRLDERVKQMSVACLDSAGGAVRKLFGNEGAEQKAAQRLLSNERVQLAGLREGLYALSFQEMEARKIRRVVVAFDPTYLDFTFQEGKSDRRQIGDGRGLGYVWLNCAMFEPQGRLLGVAHQTLVAADGPDDAEQVDYAPKIRGRRLRRELAENPAQQFLIHAQAVDRRVPPQFELVFAADREFDDGLALRSASGLSARSRFVVRSNASRVVQVRSAPWIPARRKEPSPENRVGQSTDESLVDIYLKDIVQTLPLAPTRDLPLDSRGHVLRGEGQPARIAHLWAGGIAIRLARSSKRARRAGIKEEPVWLNLVVVRELDPPEGVKPLQWVLLTDLPVETPEEIRFVVDCYSCRWRAEEFFRTTKDGMKLEQSRLDDAASTARLLFFITLKAMFLDTLRADAGLAAGAPPTDEQRRALREGERRAKQIERDRQAGGPVPPLTSRARALMLLGLAARHGGWAGRRGDSLGNYVLLDGLRIVLALISECRYLWLLQGPEDVGS
jgi:hypothetical protein